mgnify:CR=1 FL=1
MMNSTGKQGSAMAGGGTDDRISLLLVEDDADSAQAVAGMLEKRGVVATVVPGAEEAFRRFHEGAFDVIVADIRLGRLSGVDLLRLIREDQADFPVILLTGFDSLDTAVQAVRLGAQDYILKPLDDIDELVRPVRKAVQSHRLLLRNRALEEERRRAQADLERSHEELKALSARLAEAEEAERRRLGRELHDQVGQSLTVLSISLGLARGQLPGDGESDTARRLDDALRQIETLAEQIRHVMAELRPSVLDDYGLPAALRWYGEEFSRRISLPVDVQAAELTRRPSSNVETALFRITQAALGNVAQHAHARRACVTLEERTAGIRLTVADDGVGFDPAAVCRQQPRRGWGVISMRERAEAVGARLCVYSEPGKGAKVVVETGS